MIVDLAQTAIKRGARRDQPFVQCAAGGDDLERRARFKYVRDSEIAQGVDRRLVVFVEIEGRIVGQAEHKARARIAHDDGGLPRRLSQYFLQALLG